jgi:cell division protein FtsL
MFKENIHILEKHKKKLYKYIIVVFLFISFMVFYVWQRVEKDYLVVKIENLKKEKIELTRKYNKLQVDVDELSSQKRIEKIAKENLTMNYPKLGQEYYIIETIKDNKKGNKNE